MSENERQNEGPSLKASSEDDSVSSMLYSTNRAILVSLAAIIVILLSTFLVFGLRSKFSDVDAASNAVVDSALLGIAGTFGGTLLGIMRKPPTRRTDVQFWLSQQPNSPVPDSETPGHGQETPQVEESGAIEHSSESPQQGPLTGFHSNEVGVEYLWQYFEGLAGTIYSRASQIATDHGRDMQSKDVAQACTEIAPGTPFPSDQSLRQRISASITGITIISAVLAIVFGFIGFLGLRYGGEGADTVKAFIDIAQIFAGAVVGSTGAAAVSGK